MGDDRPVATAVAALAGVEVVEPVGERALAGAIRLGADGAVMLASRYTPLVADAVAASAASGERPLRWLQFTTTGFDTAARLGVPPGVTFCNAGTVWAPVVAEHAVALLLALKRALPQAERLRAQARWSRETLQGTLSALDGAVVAIAGMGGIGRATARLLRPFGCELVGVVRTPRAEPDVDRVVPLADWYSLLPETDAVVLAVPLSDDTRHLMDARAFAALKDKAVVINVARGPVVDTDALLAALRGGRLLGAGLDVFDEEPLPPDSPLWREERVILTPHVAGFGSIKMMTNLAALVADNARRFRDGVGLEHVVALPAAAVDS